MCRVLKGLLLLLLLRFNANAQPLVGQEFQ